MNPVTVAVIVPILLLCVGSFCWTVASRRAERRGNKALLDYARGSGDMLQNLAHSLPDPRSLPERIRDHAAAHGYGLVMTSDTGVGIYKRSDGSRAFTFNSNQPQWLNTTAWAEMLMAMLEYQAQKDKNGAYWSNSVIPSPRDPESVFHDVHGSRTKPNQGLAR